MLRAFKGVLVVLVANAGLHAWADRLDPLPTDGVSIVSSPNLPVADNEIGCPRPQCRKGSASQ